MFIPLGIAIMLMVFAALGFIIAIFFIASVVQAYKFRKTIADSLDNEEETFVGTDYNFDGELKAENIVDMLVDYQRKSGRRMQ